MLIYAIREGYISTNPITFKFHKTKISKEPLTLEEVRTIRTKVLGSRSMENVRDLFIFQCYTGMAYRDMASLTQNDIKVDKDGKEWIVKERVKTGIPAYSTLIFDIYLCQYFRDDDYVIIWKAKEGTWIEE